MKNYLFIGLLLCLSMRVFGQSISSSHADADREVSRPKLVIGIVVDQMRWDYLYRYYDRYQENGGFKRLLGNGFSCENTMIPYVPTVTACGHTSIYTGTVPAINGITGNEWWDYGSSKMIYCTGDEAVKTVGGEDELGQMSPKNLLVTTIGDELRLATNFRSKVIGIALKDRAAVLPAGHAANGVYWYDEKTGNWITSSYYVSQLPKWVTELNEKKLVDKYYALNWNTLYPIDTYSQSTADVQPYEHRPFGAKGFPYDIKQFTGKNYGMIHIIPYGNSFTFDMAEAAIDGEKLGGGKITDMLTISLSTPDYIGHNFGPNSVEEEDNFLRLDKDLGDFMDYLDKKIGKDAYLLFLTADHGVAQVPFFAAQHNIPTGNAIDAEYTEGLNEMLKNKLKADKLVIGVFDYQVHFDRDLIRKFGLNKDSVNQLAIDYLIQQPGVYNAIALDKASVATLNSTIKTAVINGYYPPRCGDIEIIFKPQWIEGFENGGTTHGQWNPYDSHIPLLWYGWKIRPGHTNREVYMTDIAPTVAALLHIQTPNGAIGHIIEEVAR